MRKETGTKSTDTQWKIPNIKSSNGEFITGLDINEANKNESQYIAMIVDFLERNHQDASDKQTIEKTTGEMELLLFNDTVEWPQN